MSVKSAFRKLGRAFKAQDAGAFDDAIEELEEGLEKDRGHDEEPETIEVHNHIPDARDTTMGELPPLNGGEKAFDEAPPWFAEHKKATDAMLEQMSKDIKLLKDRRGRDNGEEIIGELEPEEPEMDAEEENLEMADRRRSRDEPSEREEMAERIRENGGDRRGRNDDEANREILGELEFEAPPGTGDRARKARDSRYLDEAFQDTVSKAEVLAPGIRLPTFDKAAPPVRTAKTLFALRRTALDLAYNKPETRGIIDGAMSGRALDTKQMRPGQARVLFNTVASVVGSDNNRRATDSGGVIQRRSIDAPAGLQSTADINKRNREFYKRAV